MKITSSHEIDTAAVAKTLIAEVNAHLKSYPMEHKGTLNHFSIERIYQTIYALAEKAVSEDREFYGLGDLGDEAMGVIDRHFIAPQVGDAIDSLPEFMETGLTPKPAWL